MNQLTDSQLLDVYNGICLYEKNLAAQSSQPEPQLKPFEVWKADYLRACEKIGRAIHGGRSLQEQAQIDAEIEQVVKNAKKITLF